MKSLLPGLGWLLFLFSTFNVVTGHGTRWAFSQKGMPVSLVAEDGLHYRDGTPIDAISLGMIHAGVEEDVLLTIFSVIGSALLWVAYESVQYFRAAKAYNAVLDEEEARFKAGRRQSNYGE
jgi:hypothetical protein